MTLEDENVANPAEGCVVGHHTCEADLVVGIVDAKAKRVLDGVGNRVEGPPLRPIGAVRQEIKDDLQIETAFVGADDKLLTMNFEGLHRVFQFAAECLWGQRRGLTSAADET